MDAPWTEATFAAVSRCSVIQLPSSSRIRIVGRASAQGTLEPLHKCRGEKKALQQLLQCMLEAGYCGGKVRISHTNNSSAAEFTKLFKEKHPDCDLTIRENRGLCSYYAEEGGLLIGFET